METPTIIPRSIVSHILLFFPLFQTTSNRIGFFRISGSYWAKFYKILTYPSYDRILRRKIKYIQVENSNRVKINISMGSTTIIRRSIFINLELVSIYFRLLDWNKNFLFYSLSCFSFLVNRFLVSSFPLSLVFYIPTFKH